MNLCDYRVEEILSVPTYRGFEDEAGDIYWWEVKVSYFYDNGDLKHTTLMFDTELEATQVKVGYHFTA